MEENRKAAREKAEQGRLAAITREKHFRTDSVLPPSFAGLPRLVESGR